MHNLIELVNKINKEIEENDGLSSIPKVAFKTNGEDYIIEFLSYLIFDSEEETSLEGDLGNIEREIRKEIQKVLDDVKKISNIEK
ncbi:MAG: hypothetical protein M0R03_17170 [Novosphingobium sp.]|nr:hypothetical protein [Novosphingobium sp.]